MDYQAKAVELKALLLKIYRCRNDFELLVIDKKPKRLCVIDVFLPNFAFVA